MDLAVPVQITIDSAACKKDGLCARVCPSRIFRFERAEVPRIERAHDCVLCGQCLAVCASEALHHSHLSLARFTKITNQHPVNADDMRAFLRQRRSVRSYRSNKLVDKEMLEDIAQAAGFSPTGAFGSAGWVRAVTIVTGQEPMKMVREATVRYMRQLHRRMKGIVVRTAAHFSEEARSGLSAVPDLQMRLAEWDAGRDAVTYDAPAAIFVSAGFDTTTPHEDCDAALMNIIFAAHAHGLGTCWNGWLGNAALAAHVSGPRELGDCLGLPRNHHVAEAITIGWPSLALHSIPERETSIRWITG